MESWVPIVIVLLLVAAGVAIWYFYFKEKETEKSPSGVITSTPSATSASVYVTSKGYLLLIRSKDSSPIFFTNVMPGTTVIPLLEPSTTYVAVLSDPNTFNNLGTTTFTTLSSQSPGQSPSPTQSPSPSA